MNFFCTQAFLAVNTCDHKNTYFLIVATFEWSHFSWDSTGLLAGFFALFELQGQPANKSSE